VESSRATQSSLYSLKASDVIDIPVKFFEALNNQETDERGIQKPEVQIVHP
jgi:hypothetical protein